MKNSNKVKPIFGRKMVPCEYNSEWANKLPKDAVVVIKAEPNERVKGEER